jgi:glycolate oxidase FAD binding subunit
VIHAGWPPQAGDVTTSIDGLRADIAAHDGTVVVVDAPPEVKQQLDVWGAVQGLDVMRRVKAQFDPHGRMSPGRFVGGI